MTRHRPVAFRTIVLATLCFAGLGLTAQLTAAPDPAAQYAGQLGYDYRTIATPDGEKGVVFVASGVELDAWDFYRGKVGSDYAYGARYGYDTECVLEDRGSYQVEYAVCVAHQAKAGVARERIPQAALMARHGHALATATPRVPPPDSRAGPAPAAVPKPAVVPTSFDWRNVNGHTYIGPIRNQGNCGSCYAFGAAAAAECTYNHALNLTDAKVANFSESFIIWCLGALSAYTNNFYGCNGADYSYAELTALSTEGICDEAVFPYAVSRPASTAFWGYPRKVFAGWGRITCGDVESIKAAIMTYGAVDVAALTSGDSYDWGNYAGGIHSDNNTSCGGSPCYYTQTDHAIALVGWDDNPPEGGGGCWILRNSWGTSWGENGYMRIRYTSSAVACEVTYLRMNTPVTIAGVSGDFDRDGKAEPWIDSAGYWKLWMSGSSYASYGPIGLGPYGATPLVADFDGDGYADAAVVMNGYWYRWLSSQGYAASSPVLWTTDGSLPVAADFDGDRLADPAMTMNGLLYIRYSSTGYQLSSALAWTLAGTEPVAGDFDGDGKADPAACYNGTWYIWLSTGGYQRSGPYAFSAGGGRPLAGDFDGDGKADIVMVVNNAWYVWFSASGFAPSGPYVLP